MSIEVAKLVRKAPLNKGHKSLLLAMADYASADGSDVFPGTARLARDTGYSRRWIRKMRGDLIEMRLIVETQPPTPTRPAHYRINLDGVCRLVEKGEVSSPPEVASPPEVNHPRPLKSVPRPPEVSSPKPSLEPPLEPPDGAADELDREVEKAYRLQVEKGTPIGDPTAYKNTIRERLKPQFEEREREHTIRNATQAEIDACQLCNTDGIVAWETQEGRAPGSERCTHSLVDYEEFILIR